MKIFKPLVIAALALNLYACGKDDDDDDVVAPSAGAAALEGTYVSACEGDGGGGSYRYQTKFSGSTFTNSNAHFSDAACATKDIEEVYISSFTSVANSGAAGGYAVDLTSISAEATLYSADAVAEYNTEEYYGFTDWAINTKKSLAGRRYNPSDTTEEASPVAGEKGYALFKVEANKLYTGLYTDTLDGSTAAKRAVAFDPEGAQTKQ